MIGRVVKGKYKVYDEVGSGGFATVYLGRNIDSNEIVAIKVLSDQFTREPHYVERFRREAGLAERLRHPNIVRMLDHGIEDGTHFLVMEFVEGLTLDKIIARKRRLSVEEALSYTEQICSGLQAAYQSGIVHRDIKPANLMITPEGKVKIMDFGIARLEYMSGLTQSGMFMGTPRYISPEMATGAGADIRSDLYSLGLLIYEMLVGAPPFDADNPWAVLRQQIEEQPAPVRRIRPDVPPWLEATIMRAVAKDPAKRYQSPAEMLAALEEHTDKSQPVREVTPPVQVADATLVSVGKRGRRRNRALALILLLAAILVALGLVVLLVWGTGGRQPTPTGVAAQVGGNTATPLPTITAVVVVVTNTPGEVLLPTATELPPVIVQRTEEPSPEPTNSPEPSAMPTRMPTDTPQPTATPTPMPTDTRQPTEMPTKAPTSTPQPPSTLTSTPQLASTPTNTPQPPSTPTSPPAPDISGRIAYSVGGILYVVSAHNGGTLFALSGMRQPDFRADGAEIIADGLANPATLVNINANAGRYIREQTRHTDDFHPSWSPDGSRFVYDSLHHGLGQYTMLYTQGLTNASPQPEVTLHSSGQQIRGHSPVWMSDDFIAFTGCDYWPGGTGGSQCGIYVMPSWSETPSLIHSGSLDMRATDSHGGQLVFMSLETGNWEVFVMPNRGGTPRNLSQSPSSQDGLGTFSPDGKRVAFASNRGSGWAVWVVNLDGSGATKLFDLPGQPTAPWTEEKISWGP